LEGKGVSAAICDKLYEKENIAATAAQKSNGIPDHFAPILLNLAMRDMAIGWEKISESCTTNESTTAKEDSTRFMA
jgi:hypothetical protein